MAVKFGYIKSKLGTILGVTPFYPIGYIIEETSGVNPEKWYGGTWELYGKGCVTACIDTSDTENRQGLPSFNKSVGSTIGYKGHEMRAWIGAYDGDVGSLGYHGMGKVPGQYFDYGFKHGADHNINYGRIAHSSMVSDGSGNAWTSVVQPTILIYRWRKIAY